MKVYKKVIIEILTLEEDIIRTSGENESLAEKLNPFDDIIAGFVS